MRDEPLNRTIELRVLPGEPTDGSGRVVIHLFVQDTAGPFTEPCVLHPKVVDATGKMVGRNLVARPTRGRLACDPRRSVAPVVKRGITYVTLRTSEPGAVTCPKCLASVAYQQLSQAVREA